MNINKSQFTKYEDSNNTWLSKSEIHDFSYIDYGVDPIVLATEAEVGKAMLQELYSTAESKEGDINIALLGGRGAQELHRLLGEVAKTEVQDELLARLNVFTQDALAPMGMG